VPSAHSLESTGMRPGEPEVILGDRRPEQVVTGLLTEPDGRDLAGIGIAFRQTR